MKHPQAIRELAILGLLANLTFWIGWTPLECAELVPQSRSNISAVWANTGEDKVTRDDLRVSRRNVDVRNTCWDGQRISLFAARNETVAFNLVIEAQNEMVRGIEVAMDTLEGSDGAAITTRAASRDDLFNFVGRHIELFYVRYLQIQGVSTLSYEHYDERHVPQRFRRPLNQDGQPQGGWQERPDHDRFYPDIAVPIELHTPFDIQPQSNQSIWVDIFVPQMTPPGWYTGTLAIREEGTETHRIPVNLEVLSFTLPDLPVARTMVYLSSENINRRYLGAAYPKRKTPPYRESKRIVDRHFLLAHRHKLSLIDDYTPVDQLPEAWLDRLDGTLFTADRGYDGVGIGVGNNVYSIGSYGSWPWKEGSQREMWTNSDQWVKWFDAHPFQTPTDYFLYLIDESTDYPLIEKWSREVDANPGAGRRLLTMATAPAPAAIKQAPTLDIVCSTMMAGLRDPWQSAIRQYQQRGREHLIMYNGWRPASGCFVTEDDGVALRELAWGQFKMRIPRWFAWESTYYKNYQGGTGETNVFRQAQVFGGRDREDPVLGVTGWNYNNGDGVLFYPGTDRVFPGDNYSVPGPFASLRLKHWRRGLQDVEYLAMAAHYDRPAVSRIVDKMVPRILWELDVNDPSDPTWVTTDISWPTDPDVWESARRQLSQLIAEGKASGTR